MRPIIAILALFAGRPLSDSDDAFTRQREALVQHLAERGIRSQRVLRAMRNVPRHLFVPNDYRNFSYEDTALPIGLGQTISQPLIVAAMTELLDVSAHDRVLEIGTGSGYQAAVLSELAGEVYSIELEPELARTAAERLRSLGFRNIVAKQGDGYLGWKEKAPFDRIILTAAPPEIPAALIEQLKPGGRLVAPVGTDDQWLYVVDKTRDGKIVKRSVLAVRFVPMRHGPNR
jgi:protein-L-isoaspartate(D-aspartate) O-methyltransferase